MFEKGTADKDVIEFIQSKIRKAKLTKKLTIIDPYFFNSGKLSLAEKPTILEILKPFNQLEKLEIITKKNYNKANFEWYKKSLKNVDITVIAEENFHDRFWIIDENKAFIVGTSVNGFGNKHFFIQDDYLSDNDTQTLLNLYTKSS